MKWKVIYFILWGLCTILYFLPWASTSEKMYIGLNFTVPFSFTYLIGIIIGLVVLLTRTSPVALTVIAGIMMFIGVIGAWFTMTLLEALGEEVSIEGGLVLAFFMSLIYTSIGAYAGKKMTKE
ncbi:MAG: hypothetical protein ACTSX9_03400 [Candidatus Njordarchaeales archaeon]